MHLKQNSKYRKKKHGVNSIMQKAIQCNAVFNKVLSINNTVEHSCSPLATQKYYVSHWFSNYEHIKYAYFIINTFLLNLSYFYKDIIYSSDICDSNTIPFNAVTKCLAVYSYVLVFF